MKARTIAIASLSVLAISVVFAALFTPATAVLRVNVKFTPRSWTYDGGLPSPYWNATIWRVDPGLINPATVQVTGETSGRTIYPVAYEISYAGRNDFIACFNPADMKSLITDILIFHYWYGVPGTYRLTLVLTGNLYDGTAIRGTGTIAVTVPNSPS